MSGASARKSTSLNTVGGIRVIHRQAITPAVLGNPTVIQGLGPTHLRQSVCTA